MRADFEDFKDRYTDVVQAALPFSGLKHDFFTEVKAEHLVRLVRGQRGGPQAAEVLDVGCGIGLTDSLIAPHVGRLAGVDISPGVVARAASLNPAASYEVYDGNTLPFPDSSFDLVFAVNVLHHVPPPHWPGTVHEMRRVCREGGSVVVFEHNPYNPLTRRVVGRCELDDNAVLLKGKEISALFERSGLRRVERRYILFFPFRGRAFRWADDRLGWLPLGAQYCVVGTKLAGNG